MKTLTIGYCVTGAILLSNLLCISQGARRYTRRPVFGENWVRENYLDRFGTRSTGYGKQNTGSLSDLILSATRTTINGHPPLDQNTRGSIGGRPFRPISPEPMMVNYTAQDIVERFPWIVNPTGVHGLLRNYLPNSVPGGPDQQQMGGNKDGRIRFNNPTYLREWLDGLNQDNYGFRLAQGVLGANGKYKVRLNQNWRDIPVYGSSMVMEQENDTNFILESADGQFVSGIEDDIASEIPTLTSEDAINRAIRHNGDHGKMIQHPNAQLVVDTVGDKAVLCYLINYVIPEGVLPNILPTEQPTMPPTASTTTSYSMTRRPFSRRFRRRRKYRRGQRFQSRRRFGRRRGRRNKRSAIEATTAPMINITEPEVTTPFAEVPAPDVEEADAGSRRPWVRMDANTGEVLEAWNGLSEFIRPSSINIITGNRAYEVAEHREVMYRDDVQDACYYQKPLGRRVFFRVNDKTDSPTANVYKFRCGEGRNVSYDFTNGAPSPRNSAFKWGSDAINFLRRVSRIRWNFDVNVEVHHRKTTAHWDGFKIRLGDGTKDYFYPLTSPDYLAHEVAHAFTEHVSNLQYNQQSAAINEAYSDMAASAFMDHVFDFPEHQLYLMGRLALKKGVAMRDMCNPRNPNLLFYQPNKLVITSSTQFQTFTHPHNASALYNKAFCELSKSRGWDIQQAFRVFTNANVIYWRPRETFNSAACGVKKAAHDFKNTVQAVRDVDRAFAIVDIACDSNDWINLLAAPAP